MYHSLVIGSGTGADTASAGDAPWNDIRTDIWQVVFSGSVVLPENCAYLFSNMGDSFSVIDASKLDSSNVTNMSHMFENSRFSNYKTAGLCTSRVTSTSHMFDNCYEAKTIDLSGFDTSNVTDMSYMFWFDRALKSLDVSGFDTSKVASTKYMFYRCSGLTSLDVSGFDTSDVKDMSSMFNSCTSLTSLNVSEFNTGNATNMQSMFTNCTQVKELDVSGFNTSNVTNFKSMFSNCYGVDSLDVSGFDTSKARSMGEMFYGCNNLKALDLSGFDISNVTDLTYMFNNCTSIESLDLSNFEPPYSARTTRMFYGDTALKTIIARDWTVGGDSAGMFTGCASIVGMAGTTYDSSHVDSDYAMIDKAPGRPGYFTYVAPADVDLTFRYEQQKWYFPYPKDYTVYKASSNPDSDIRKYTAYSGTLRQFTDPVVSGMFVFQRYKDSNYSDKDGTAVLIDGVLSDDKTYYTGSTKNLIELDRAGNFYFTVTCTSVGDEDQGYSNKSFEGTITVAASETGDALVATEVPSVPAFRERTIIYPAVLEFIGTKAMSGRKLTGSDKFQFSVSGGQKYSSSEDKTYTTENSLQTITFPDVYITKPGTYTYRIVEERGSDTGMTYDNAVKTVTVKASDPVGTGDKIQLTYSVK